MQIIDTAKCYNARRGSFVDPANPRAGFVPKRHFYCDYGILTSADWTYPNNEWLFDHVRPYARDDDETLDIPYLLAGVNVEDLFGEINVQIPNTRKFVHLDGELATQLYLREKCAYLDSDRAGQKIPIIEVVDPSKDCNEINRENRKRRFVFWHELLNLNKSLHTSLNKKKNKKKLTPLETTALDKYAEASAERNSHWHVKQGVLLQSIASEIPTQQEVSAAVGHYLQRLTELWIPENQIALQGMVASANS